MGKVDLNKGRGRQRSLIRETLIRNGNCCSCRVCQCLSIIIFSRQFGSQQFQPATFTDYWEIEECVTRRDIPLKMRGIGYQATENNEGRLTETRVTFKILKNTSNTDFSKCPYLFETLKFILPRLVIQDFSPTSKVSGVIFLPKTCALLLSQNKETTAPKTKYNNGNLGCFE